MNEKKLNIFFLNLMGQVVKIVVYCTRSQGTDRTQMMMRCNETVR